MLSLRSRLAERARTTHPQALELGYVGVALAILNMSVREPVPWTIAVAVLPFSFLMFYGAVMLLGLAGFRIERGRVPGFRRYAWGFVAVLVVLTAGLVLFL